MNRPKLAFMQSAENELSLYIYDDVTDERYDWWTGTENESNSRYIADRLAEHPTAEKINVYINSYGGDVKEGVAIYSLLKRCSARVFTFIDGFACSVASLIAMVGDEITIGENAMMMIHHAWWPVCGNPSELRKSADDLENIDKSATDTYLKRSGGKLTPEKLSELLDAETWLNAEQCIEYGLADKIAGREEDEETKAQNRLNAAKQAAEDEAKIRMQERNKKIMNALRKTTTKINGGM